MPGPCPLIALEQAAGLSLPLRCYCDGRSGLLRARALRSSGRREPDEAQPHTRGAGDRA